MTTLDQLSRRGLFRGSALGRGLGSQAADFAARLLDRLEVMRRRRQLLALTDHELKDIGLSRADALREGQRGFWDLPEQATGRR